MGGEDGQRRCGMMGHASVSLRCPDPVGKFQLCQLDMQLALLCLSFFLLRPPSMKCCHSPSSSFVADRIETAGRCSWMECSFSTEARHQLLMKPFFLHTHMLFPLLSQAYSVCFCHLPRHIPFLSFSHKPSLSASVIFLFTSLFFPSLTSLFCPSAFYIFLFLPLVSCFLFLP